MSAEGDYSADSDWPVESDELRESHGPAEGDASTEDALSGNHAPSTIDVKWLDSLPRTSVLRRIFLPLDTSGGSQMLNGTS